VQALGTLAVVSTDANAGPGPDPERRSSVDVGDAELVGQQLAVYRALVEQSTELAGLYLGACVVLMVPANPERLQQAAHSVRELINNLHTISNLPVPAEGGRLGDKFDHMTQRWEKAKRNSAAFGEDGWSGCIDDAARRGFVAVDEAIEWQRENRPKWKERHRSTLRGLDVSARPLPGFVEDHFVEIWHDLRGYFVDVCHHDRETTETEFASMIEQLEKMILDRLKPRTFRDQAKLDTLIAEAEGGA
jgi:hypothetical protein